MCHGRLVRLPVVCTAAATLASGVVAAAGELCCLFGVPVRGGLFLAYDSHEAWRVCAVQGAAGTVPTLGLAGVSHC